MTNVGMTMTPCVRCLMTGMIYLKPKIVLLKSAWRQDYLSIIFYIFPSLPSTYLPAN